MTRRAAATRPNWSEMPGVSLRENGQLASIPFLHGMGDERTKMVVDGMTISAACPNHMNPTALLYRSVQCGTGDACWRASRQSAWVETAWAERSRSIRARRSLRTRKNGCTKKARSSGFYRSNGENYGGSLTEWVAGRNLGIGYSGSWATNDDYTDGSGHKVTSTYAQTTDHTVTLAAQDEGNFVVLEAGLHHTPYEGFVNAQMDLVRNYAESLNLHYHRNFAHGALDARVYWQNTWHSMNIGKDKSTFPMPMWMPMNTHGRDLGYTVKLEAPLSDAAHTARRQ